MKKVIVNGIKRTSHRLKYLKIICTTKDLYSEYINNSLSTRGKKEKKRKQPNKEMGKRLSGYFTKRSTWMANKGNANQNHNKIPQSPY